MTEKLKNDEQLRQKPVSAVRQSGPFDIEVSRGWSVTAKREGQRDLQNEYGLPTIQAGPGEPSGGGVRHRSA
jgi:hypothetical protein